MPGTTSASPTTAQINAVREHLITAIQVLKMMPMGYRDRPARLKSLWGDYRQEPILSASSTRRAVRAKASPEQISAMEYWLDFVILLDDDCRKVVIARACRIPWRRLEELDGRSHTTLRKIERRGLEVISRHADHER